MKSDLSGCRDTAGAGFYNPYVKPNCDELGYSFDPYIMRSNGFIIGNHGCLVLGPGGVKETVEYVNIMEGVAKSIGHDGYGRGCESFPVKSWTDWTTC